MEAVRTEKAAIRSYPAMKLEHQLDLHLTVLCRYDPQRWDPT